MFKHYFEQIQGIELWPIISLIIFFLFFIVIVVRVIRTDRGYIQHMKDLPFEEDELKEPENQVEITNA